MSPSGNPEFKTPTFRYTYQSFTTPPSVFDYDFATGQSTLLKETEVLGGYDRDAVHDRAHHGDGAPTAPRCRSRWST